MSKLSWGDRGVIIVSILLLLSFFLPWLSVSSGEQVIHTYNGYRMAIGGPIAIVRYDLEGYSVLQYPGKPYTAWLFVLPGAAGLVLVLVGVAAVRRRVSLLTSAAWWLLGVMGLVILTLGLQGIRSAYWGSVSFQTHYGLWLTFAGLVVSIVAALLTYSRYRFFEV